VSLVNLRNYDLVITTSFGFKFGICGHLFEMIEYYWAIKNWTNLNPCILLSDGTTIDEFNIALNTKYDNLVVDDFYINNKAQCHLFQDFEIYDDIPKKINVFDYKKKLLYSKFKKINDDVENSVMFYLTDVSRFMSEETITEISNKYSFNNTVVFTNKPELYTKIKTYKVPVPDMWNKFSTYVYTKLPGKKDCSNRFILECMHYDKEVVYDIDYYDKALEIRKKDGIKNTSLEQGDFFINYINEQIKC